MDDKPNRSPEKRASENGELLSITATGAIKLAPGGSYLVDLLKLHKDRARDAVRKRDEETLNAFFSDLFDGSTALEQSIADAMIDD